MVFFVNIPFLRCSVYDFFCVTLIIPYICICMYGRYYALEQAFSHVHILLKTMKRNLISFLAIALLFVSTNIFAQHSLQFDNGVSYSLIVGSTPGGIYTMPPGGGTILTSSGSGTINTLPKWTTITGSLGNSLLSDNATTLTYTGTGGLKLSGSLTMTTAANIITNPGTEMIMEQTGAGIGPTRIRLQNILASNGMVLEQISANNVVDLGMKPGSGLQSNLRLETRAAFMSDPVNNTNGEFQLWDNALGAATKTFVVGKSSASFATTVGIGVAVPTQTLDVNGTALIRTSLILGNSPFWSFTPTGADLTISSAFDRLIYRINTDAVGSGEFNVYLNNSGTPTLQVTGGTVTTNGNLSVTGNTTLGSGSSTISRVIRGSFTFGAGFTIPANGWITLSFGPLGGLADGDPTFWGVTNAGMTAGTAQYTYSGWTDGSNVYIRFLNPTAAAIVVPATTLTYSIIK